ncbi:carboxypeptidase regulatory-like domain-containing protein [Massilia sp. PAMC28688]|uniref:carboxypeptidase regulatory-like domain-containing protein n=1 Tax=Massilia sp. PAMC28688 TaxID=2861283 RepID=UPI001C637568|nr:carboxypeptidase regulatory-like domain-containing protein [Massilia sp. PAMC28688]QYF93557.1 carboxypeptidase regulatory-like domain-containing protein [Massilia sp. PAMC28688]
MQKFQRIVTRCVLFFAISLSVLFAARAQSPEIARGLAWLAAQVQADGEVQGADQSIATKQQNRAEVRQTLKLLAAAPPSLGNAMLADPENNTEYLARKIIALAGSGNAITVHIDLLIERQNSDGGFGGAPGYASNALDTAWAVLALTEARMGAAASATSARAWLLTQLDADGAITGRSDADRVQNSAMALLALQTAADSASINAVRSLSSWLLRQQGADGGWQEDTYLSALSLAAVSPVTADAAVRTAGRNFLLARQAADGSWDKDPYLTALVLRAISGQQSLPPTGGGVVQGRVIDQGSGLPLAGVTITLSGAESRTVNSDVQGTFSVPNLTAGSYRITYARTGYTGAIASASIVLGQTLDAGTVGLTQLTTAGIVRGQVTVGASGAPLAGVTITVDGVPPITAVSDAAGRYELVGVTPGTVSVSASASGYQTVSGSAVIAAGQALSFSPALYPASETPSGTVRYQGQVVAAGTVAPLAGVSVELSDGTSVFNTSSDGNGQFSITLNPGSYSAAFSLAGYNGVTQRFVGPAGSIMNAGVVSMTQQRTSSAVKGRVINASGEGIAGASVQLTGTAAIATTAADGSYRIENLSGLTFALRASASGYNSQAVTLQASGPTELLQDFTLASQGVGQFTIGTLDVTPASVGSASDITVNTSIANAGDASATAVIQLQVRDQNQKVIGTGTAFDTEGNLIGQTTLAAGAQQVVRLVWNSAQHPPGSYSLHVRLLEAGSLQQATPQGVLLIERVGAVAVTGKSAFGGTITANPPVLQSGTSTPVKLSAVVQNKGNQPIAAQSYILSVIDVADASVVHTEQAAGGALAVSALETLAFSDWTPAKGGNYRLELSAADPALGKLTSTLYVGNAVTAKYTASKVVVPAGTQSVRGTIKLNGADIVNGTLSDPLAPLVKAAIQKSVTYNDREAVNWTVRQGNCIGCHIQTQALVGGETNRLHATFNPAERSALYNLVKSRQQASGAFFDSHPGYAGTSSMLAMWSLDAWTDKAASITAINKGADYLATIQQSNGSWPVAHPWLGGYTHPVDHTALNLKSLVGLHAALTQVPAAALKAYPVTPYLPEQQFRSRGNIATDQAGNFYVSMMGQGKVQQYKPDGSLGESWTGLSDPRGLLEARSGGGMLVCTTSGVFRLSTGNVSTKLNSRGSLEMLAYAPDGTLYANDYAGNNITRLDASFVPEVWLHNPVFQNPDRILFSPSGELLVLSYYARKVFRVKEDRTVDIVITDTVFDGYPRDLFAYDGGWMLGTTSGTWRINDKWKGDTLLRERADKLNTNVGTGHVVLADGRIISVNYNAIGMRQMQAQELDVAARRTKLADMIDKATVYMQNQSLTSSDTLVQAHQLMGLGESARFYANDTERRTALETKMKAIAATLRQRQRADGSWGVTANHTGDSFVTAHVGYALDYLNPSPSDPYIRSAVQWLLARQQADGSWTSENGLFGTRLAATTWVSIWLPVILNRLGGIDTDLSVTFPANVKMSNPDLVPTATAANPDGSSTYQWQLTGVTSADRSLSYDLSLIDMQLGETRAVSTDAHMTFKNSFTGGMVNAPIDVPSVKASSFLDLGVTTDKPAYPAHTMVDITGQVTNSGGTLTAGRVTLGVYAPDRTLITMLAEEPFNGLASGASVRLDAYWNTGAYPERPGYIVLATLLDEQGRQIGTAQTQFAILGAAAGTPVATATLAADKLVYQPFATVQLKERLSNIAQNSDINNASVTTTVRNPAGDVVLSRTEKLAQLAQGQSRDYGYSLPLRPGMAGNYMAALSFTGADGKVLAAASTQFAVASSDASGVGLSGALGLSTKQLQLGASLAMAASATNSGNAALADLPLSIRIIDMASKQVVAELNEVQTVATGARHEFGRNWIGAGTVGSRFTAALSATVAGKPLLLAQDDFMLVDQAVKLDIKQAFASGSRILVLVSCNDGEHDAVGPNGQPPVCETQRSRTIDEALTTLGMAHTIVTSEEAFRRELRSGLYNTYWISGKQDKLHDDLPVEVREAVFSGDGLILDGVHDSRNKVLNTVVGVKYQGKIGETDLPVELTGPWYTSQRLNTVGRAQKPELVDSRLQAVFDGRHPQAGGVAIASNAYGSGQAVLFAFDLARSLEAHDQWLPVLGTTLRAVLPGQSQVVTPGGMVRLRTSIGNLAGATDLAVDSSLPAGAAYLNASAPGSYDANSHSAQWRFTLGKDQNTDLYLSLRAPATAGAHAIDTVVSSVVNGVATKYGPTLTQGFTVKPASQTAVNVKTAIGALVIARTPDRRVRDRALAQFDAAMLAFNRNTASGYDTAIQGLLQVTDMLESLSAVDTTAARLDIDRILREAQWRWSAAQ